MSQVLKYYIIIFPGVANVYDHIPRNLLYYNYYYSNTRVALSTCTSVFDLICLIAYVRNKIAIIKCFSTRICVKISYPKYLLESGNIFSGSYIFML